MIKILCTAAKSDPDLIEAMRGGTATEEQLVGLGRRMYERPPVEGDASPPTRRLYCHAPLEVLDLCVVTIITSLRDSNIL